MLRMATTVLLVALASTGVRAAPATKAQLVGLVLASGQALIWDGKARRYVLLRKGDRFRGVRILGLGADRILAERRGTKFIWKLGAPPLVDPSRARGHRGRTPELIVAPVAPPPPRPGARRRGPRSTLPPVPRAADEPTRLEVKRGAVALATLRRLARDFGAARVELELEFASVRRLRVRRVRAGGPVAKLGLKAGDLIRRVQGRAIGSAADAAEVFAGLRVGQTLRIDLARGARLIDLRVRLR